MIQLLEHFNYKQPNIPCGTWGPITIAENSNGYYYLTINGKQWMAYNSKTHLEAYELYSHYYLAEGHVILTGLGFGIRENWLLTKKEVTKLTIIENSKELIDLHYKIGSPFLSDSRVEIINTDASNYVGKCDVLLLDHYELDNYESILADVKKIQNNIKCNVMWFWPLEKIIMHSRKWHTFNDYPYELITKHKAFNLLKKNWGLDKLPNYSDDEINFYCMMFHSKLFSQSEFIFKEFFLDRDKYQHLYNCI